MSPTLDDIYAAAKRIGPYIHHTPVLTNESLNQKVGAQVFLKCENLQKVGAFKFRGACNAVFSLSNEEAARGVSTHSSGNHAQALALAASLRGIPAYIVMPNNAPAAGGAGASLPVASEQLASLLAFDQIDGELHVCRGFQRRSRHFTVSHGGVGIANAEQRAGSEKSRGRGIWRENHIL